jgi:cbb3-type cytochrome oxidase subunit 1
MYLTGVLIMVYNLWRTIRGDVRERESAPALAPQPALAAAE